MSRSIHKTAFTAQELHDLWFKMIHQNAKQRFFLTNLDEWRFMHLKCVTNRTIMQCLCRPIPQFNAIQQ